MQGPFAFRPPKPPFNDVLTPSPPKGHLAAHLAGKKHIASGNIAVEEPLFMHMGHAGSHVACPQQLQILRDVRLFKMGLEATMLGVFNHHEDRPTHCNDSHELSHK